MMQRLLAGHGRGLRVCGGVGQGRAGQQQEPCKANKARRGRLAGSQGGQQGGLRGARLGLGKREGPGALQ